MPMLRGFALVPRIFAVLLAAAVWYGGAAVTPAQDAAAPGTEEVSLAELYRRARTASDTNEDEQYRRAADAIVARGDEAVAFLAERLDRQAEKVRIAEDLRPSGLLVTLNLLGRMNAYPKARAALEKLKAHPVEDVGKWARYSLLREARTRPTATVATAPATQPGSTTRRAEGDRIVTDEGWFRRPKRLGPPRPEKPSKVFVIEIREPISSKTYDAMKRKVLLCITGGADLVVLDMDTFGGEAKAALDIARLLKKDLGKRYTLCYVRTRAISAGALIAVACDEIAMTPVGKLGDCAPIVMGGTLAGVEREKIETVLRTEFSESAERNGYNIALAESMVSIGKEVWLIRNDRTGELRFVDKDDWQGRVQIPPGIATAPSAETASWRLLRVVVPADELLTMKTSQALEYGFASRKIEEGPKEAPLSNLLKAYDVQGQPVILADTWSERLAEFLMQPGVLGFLLFAGLLCGYVEMHTPGFGVAGSIAILCFAVLFGSRYLTGMAQWWEIGLFVVGLGLLAVEVFVTPGFGVLGTAGIICCIVGLLGILVANAPDRAPLPESPLAWEFFANGLFAMGLAFVAALVAGYGLSQYLPRLEMARGLVMGPARAPAEPTLPEDSPIARIQPGATGTVVGDCRPVGKVLFGDDLVDVVTEGEPIGKGAVVRVLRRDGNRIVVEKTQT